jgi:hypothetical protein
MCSVLIDVIWPALYFSFHPLCWLAQTIGSWSKPLPSKKNNAAIGKFFTEGMGNRYVLHTTKAA